MGTKNNPGKFDCHSRAEPDEPTFTLLGRDPVAPMLIAIWAHVRELTGEDPEKVAEARACAKACEKWFLNYSRQRPEKVDDLRVACVLVTEKIAQVFDRIVAGDLK